MENDSKKELERLKRKLSAMNRETEELLVDIPIEVMESEAPEPEVVETPSTGEAPQAPAAEQQEPDPEMEKAILQGRKETAKMLRRENRWVVGLMLLASVLCVGIIGVLLYWLEVFLK